MVLSWQQAKGLVVVNPDTGQEIQHVKAADPEAGRLEVYSTTACDPSGGYEMLRFTKDLDGKELREELCYTFIVSRDPVTNQRQYLTVWHCCAYDLVDKRTGEVMYEVAGPVAPRRVLEPWTCAAEHQALMPHRV